MLKMHCMLCKQPKELTIDDLKETAKFVRDNELDSAGYEDFIAAKVGRKCKGVDGKGERLKLHKYDIDEEDRKDIIETTNNIVSNNKKTLSLKSEVVDTDNKIAELNNKIVELEKEKIELQEKLPAIEEEIKKGKEKLFELVGDDRETLWIK